MGTLIYRNLFGVMFLASVLVHGGAALLGHTETATPKLKAVVAGRASISLRALASTGPKPTNEPTAVVHAVEKPKEPEKKPGVEKKEPPSPPPMKPIARKEQPASKAGPMLASAPEKLPLPAPAAEEKPTEKPAVAKEPPKENKPIPPKDPPQFTADEVRQATRGSVGSKGADVDQLPRGVATNQAPVYPREAQLAGHQGRVVLWIRIDATGRVARVHVHKSSGFESIDNAAMAAVREWEFEPARRGNVPVPYEVLQGFPFSIERP